MRARFRFSRDNTPVLCFSDMCLHSSSTFVLELSFEDSSGALCDRSLSSLHNEGISCPYRTFEMKLYDKTITFCSDSNVAFFCVEEAMFYRPILIRGTSVGAQMGNQLPYWSTDSASNQKLSMQHVDISDVCATLTRGPFHIANLRRHSAARQRSPFAELIPAFRTRATLTPSSTCPGACLTAPDRCISVQFFETTQIIVYGICVDVQHSGTLRD